jgi:hypothetical protein
MTHPTEAELIAYREGQATQPESTVRHLADCAECRAEIERIEAVLAALDTLPVPDPGEDYGRRVWQQIAPRLPEKRASWWQFGLTRQSTSWLEPRRWVALGAVAALVIAAFLAGQGTRHHGPEPNVALDANQVRERVLWMSVGEHLGRSEMLLVELANAQPANPKLKQVNISSEQRRAEDLLEENRLYRQTAMEQGDTSVANLLDELERVLLDVAHSPDKISPAQLQVIRERMASQGLLFKVRVVGKELQQREESIKTPLTNGIENERNKV